MQRWDTEGGAAESGPQQGPRKKRPRDANQLAKSIVSIATGEEEDRKPNPPPLSGASCQWTSRRSPQLKTRKSDMNP
jgi:hypothetical protein